MKKILFRKLLYDCLIFFLITLFSASIIIWVFQAVNFLDIMIEDGRDYWVYFSYSLLNLPKTVSKLFPFALFFSFTYILSKYELNNELMIFWNFGISKIDLINFFVKFSFILFLFQVLFTSILVPKSQDLARNFIRGSSFNFFENFIKPKRFSDSVRGLTIYSEEKDNDGIYKNVYLKKKINSLNFQITYAKNGYFKKIGPNPILVLLNGETISFNNGKVTIFKFSESDYNLNNSTSFTITRIKTQEMSTINLVKCLEYLYDFGTINIDKNNFKLNNCSIKNSANVVKEFYKRFIIPLYIPVLMMVSLLLIINSKENINYIKQRIYIFLLGVIIIIFSETTLRFISKDLFENIKIVIIPLILIIFFYLIFLKYLKINLSKK
jgi:lipopolysaccharide export system permease protein